jgi:hypothetical protein
MCNWQRKRKHMKIKKERSHTSLCVTEDPIPSCPKSFRPVENTRPLSAPKHKGKYLLHYDAITTQTGKK